MHGDRRADDYFWLRGKDDPEVMAYLRAENAHTEAVMKPSAALVDTLYAEMLARIKEDDQTVPYRRGDHFYYSRTEQGKQYPILCRKMGSVDAPEEVTLDLNALAAGHPFFALGMAVVSDDGHLLAYTTDLTGFRQYTLSVKDLRTGALLPDRIEKVVSIAWAADDRTLFYVTEDAAKRPYRLYRHVLGAAADDLVYEETDALFNLGVERTRSRRYLLATSASFTTTEVRYHAAAETGAPWTLILAPGAGSRVPRRALDGRGRGRALLHPHQWRRPAELSPRHRARGGSAPFELDRAHRAPRRRDARGRRGVRHAPRGPRAGRWAEPPAGDDTRRRRRASHRVPGARVRGVARPQPGVRRILVPVALPVARHAALGVRL